MLQRVWVLAFAACGGCMAKPDRPAADCWSTTVTHLDMISSEGMGQAGPWLEGNELWYTLIWDPTFDQDIRRATYAANMWSGSDDPMTTSGSFNTGKRENDPFFDGQNVMWFSGNAPAGGAQSIFEATRTGDLVFTDQVAHPELGTRAGGSLQPSLTADGLAIYFSTDGTTISTATRAQGIVAFDQPHKLVSTHQIESPSIAADGETLYFTDHFKYTGSQALDATRIARGHIASGQITDIELVGGFQQGDQVSYSDPHVARDGSTLAFTITQAGTSRLAYVRACGP